ncbi:MAG: HIG1 domain-containing protein [Alphaproteobacteria bacterium]|nr:HIG1 domain-containing protein [Alphaproteobacteria bacterium]
MAVALVMVAGVVTLSRGKRVHSPAEEARRAHRSNRLMIARVSLQALAVSIFALAYWLAR